MNRHHLLAFLWLRWRIRLNQLKRAGIATVVVLIVLAPIVVLVPLGLFIGLFLMGYYVIADAAAQEVHPYTLYVWDALVVSFLFAWATGLMADLQRSEVLSLDKFLHLPVSVKGVFLINYLSSLVSFNMVLFLPPMVGLSLGMAFGKGPMMLLVLPLLAAFMLMITALTYQFQGWLAALIVNKRRRRTVVALVTLGFVVLCNIPNLINLARPQPWERLGANQHGGRSKEQGEKEIQKMSEQVEQVAWVVNLCLPPGWLALGAECAAEGSAWPALLGTLGLGLIGAASLRRAYKTTLRLYTGQYSAGRGQQRPADLPPSKPDKPASMAFLERELPWLSEEASAIAVAGLRGLLRAPEAKMMLLTPVIMVILFVSMLAVKQTGDLPEPVRPLMAFGGMAMVLLGMIQLLGNQFGFDRSGFRVFVLCAAPRKDILLGKNLAFAPLAMGLAWPLALLLQVLMPMRLDHLLATLPQLVTMYLLVCLVANCLSIVAPMPIASGSMKPAQPKLIPILLQVAFVLALPLVLAPTLLPLAIEVVLEQLGMVPGVPVCLLLTLVECATVVFLYRLALTWEGSFLHGREQRILETVTTKAE